MLVHRYFWGGGSSFTVLFFSHHSTGWEICQSDISAECAAWKRTDIAFILYLRKPSGDLPVQSSPQALYGYFPSTISTIQLHIKLNATLSSSPPLFSVVHSGLIEKSFFKDSQWVRGRLGQWAVSVCGDRRRYWEQTGFKALTEEDCLTVASLASQWRRPLGTQGCRGVLALLCSSKLHYITELCPGSILCTNCMQC